MSCPNVLPSQSAVFNRRKCDHKVEANSVKIFLRQSFRGHRFHLRMVTFDLDVVKGGDLGSQNEK